MSDAQQMSNNGNAERRSLLDKVIRFCLENKLVVALVVIAVLAWGVMVAPFDWDLRGLPRDPVPVNLSVAVWVGFLALFGIATDDGVVITTYLDQSFSRRRITTYDEARRATLAAGLRRVRPCLMTTATTILALIPVLTSTGRGSDIIVPMAIPSFGGMVIEIMTMLVVPVLYCSVQEWKLKVGVKDPQFAQHTGSES